jgi:uncharacterized coiled-coil protein SlyX
MKGIYLVKSIGAVSLALVLTSCNKTEERIAALEKKIAVQDNLIASQTEMLLKAEELERRIRWLEQATAPTAERISWLERDQATQASKVRELDREVFNLKRDFMNIRRY